MRCSLQLATCVRNRILAMVSAALFLPACSPVTISRIGQQQQPRTSGCEIEVLKKGEKPSRPYKDVGVVALENCYDYTTPPCLGWLENAACELGGHVAYMTEERREPSPFDPVVYRVMVAAYLSEMEPHHSVDRELRSRMCNPECEEGEICRDGQCIVSSGTDCDRSVSARSQDEQASDRCYE